MAQIQFHHVHSSRPCGQLGKHKFVVRRRHQQHHHHHQQQQPYCQPLAFNSRLFLTSTEHLSYSSSSSSSSSSGSSSCCSSSTSSSSASSTTTNSSINITDIAYIKTNNNNIKCQENNDHHLNQRQQQQNHFSQIYHQQQYYLEQQLDLQEQQTPLLLIGDGYQPSNKMDPVYLEDDEVFYNLMRKESTDIKERQLAMATYLGATFQSTLILPPPPGTASELGRQLEGQLRHSILSWMLKVCDRQSCQDEIFPLATMILDKFLLLHPTVAHTALNNKNLSADDSNATTITLTSNNGNGHHLQQAQMATGNLEIGDDEFYCDEQELKQYQLYLLAACSLLLAAKLRQTPLLSIQILIEFSRIELPVELAREEILDAELLVLATLKWDLATLVTPNDFLAVLLRKCRDLMASQIPARTPAPATTNTTTMMATTTATMMTSGSNTGSDESRVRRHTQTLLELCLMDSQLSQFPPSIMAMASMAVAIDGLSMTEKTCRRLNEIVAQIHEATHKVNELKQMIDVASQIERYVQKLHSTLDD